MPLLSRAILYGAVWLAVLPSPAAASPPCSGPAVTIEVDGLKDRSGRIIAELYPANQEDFLKDRDQLARENKVFRRSVAPVAQDGQVHICISAPSSGSYALIVIHDRDGLDKFSIARDGLALPAADAIGAARPRLRQAIVTFGSSPRTLRVTMQYLRGLRGFAPRPH